MTFFFSMIVVYLHSNYINGNVYHQAYIVSPFWFDLVNQIKAVDAVVQKPLF